MEKLIVAGKSPIPGKLKKGESFYWYSWERSLKQPFCDGSHKGTFFTHMKFTAEKDETAYLCASRKIKNPQYCDWSHQNL
jgi:CDGSH-type Zn-finger protein